MLRITTLCENTTGDMNFIAEYGLSVLIESDETTILFDTGLEKSVCHNAPKLGIDLKKIDKIVLSHGHPDHTGGLREVLRHIDKEIDIYAHPAVWSSRHTQVAGKERFLGIPFRREQLEKAGAIFCLSADPVYVAEKIFVTGEIPMTTDFEDIESSLPTSTSWWIKKGDIEEKDTIPDDQAVVIKTDDGLFIILGCGHRGIINTIYHAQYLTGEERICAVIGGAHLMHAGKERLNRTIKALRELDVHMLGLCHCTGLPVAARLSQEFDDRFFFNCTGSTLTIP